MEEIYQIRVTEDKKPINKLNELEYINGEIFANVFETDTIVKIDPDSGAVTGWINLNGLLKKEKFDITVDVMNGIAFDSINNRIFVTGKLWPYIFEIEITGKN